jgi:hypothetical protein
MSQSSSRQPATDDANITARFDVDGHPMNVHYRIDTNGHVTSLMFRTLA